MTSFEIVQCINNPKAMEMLITSEAAQGHDSHRFAMNLWGDNWLKDKLLHPNAYPFMRPPTFAFLG